MTQFNQAAAEKIIYGRTLLTSGEAIRAIKQYLELPEPPTPEIIEFDLDKLKTGEWVPIDAWNRIAVKYRYDEEFDFIVCQYEHGKVFYNSSDCPRLIRKPVPTKKVWKNVYHSKAHDNYRDAVKDCTMNVNYIETICIEEPIKNS